jgi:hypothetical protein
MSIRSLAEVDAYLRSLHPPPDCASDPEANIEYLEHICYQVLDGQFEDFTPGALQEYLEAWLYLKRLELDLIPFPDPGEE